MPIIRSLLTTLESKIKSEKVLVLYGARRTGKTFLLGVLKGELEQKGKKVLVLNGESRVVQENISSRVPAQLMQYIGTVDILIIDEAQKIEHIGEHLKLIVDTMPHLAVIASGSASFDLAQKVGDPLTGRNTTAHLFPVSAREIIATYSMDQYVSTRDTHVIYGGYPELFSLATLKEKQEYLHELVDAYLLKDILEMEQVRGAKKLHDLLVLLAFQIGGEVSLTELGNNLDMSKDTVARYLDLLEKAFVIVNVRGFSRNLRKEVTKNSRYYFCDNGIRNALINNFNPLHLRDDVGMLWENYIIMERLKKQSYDGILSNNYFWRTYDKKEVDWVEEREGVLHGYEIKSGTQTPRAPSGWLTTYTQAQFEVINKDTYLPFIA